MTAHPAILMNSVSAAYGRHVAMRGVSLRVDYGDFVGVIGPNGAGKTTILTVINGLGHIVGGTVQALGTVVTPHTAGRLRKRIGYVAQQDDIDPLLPISVLESVLCGACGRVGLFRRIPASIRHRAIELLTLVGMRGLISRPLGHLSGGERQRVAIARALIQKPDILLLDEPTAALDWQAQREILLLIRDIHTRFGLTSLIVTHDLNTLPDVVNRVAFMKNGELIWQGPPDAAMDECRLSRLYGTNITIATSGGRSFICH